MTPQGTLWWCGTVLSLAVVLVLPPGLAAGAEAPDWWQAQRGVTATLLGGQKDLVQLVTDAGATKPANAQEALFRVSVFLRAGMPRETIQALGDLKTQCPDLQNYQVSSIYYDACDGAQAWAVAKAAVELFAENLSDLSLEGRLLRHLEDTGWTVEAVDRWLADRPRGVGAFWVKERLRFNTAHGRGDALVQELADGVRANPADVPSALVFLEALLYARRGAEGQPDLAWLAATVKPPLATQAADLGSRLATLGDLATAAVFLRQAIETPLTAAEARGLALQHQAIMPDATLRAAFAARTREDLATCLLGLGRHDEAQMWMVAAADIREQNHLGQNALLAGQVQGASGERVIEERLQAAEQTSEDDPTYWRDRAHYYRGRKETAQEEDALRKGLALTTPQPAAARPAQKGGATDQRARMLSDYAAFLLREKRQAEAVALLRGEIESAPADAASAQTAARVLAFDHEKQVSVADEILWRWLANRPRWEQVEERLLWRMLENVARERLEAPFTRAEKLTLDRDASRAAVLGWIMNRMDFPQRSLALLQRALRDATDQDLRERAGFTLFESYLATGDWQQAEAAFPDAARRLTAREAPAWLGRIAVCAAKAGAKADALRLWSRVTNLDLTATAGLDGLAKAGLRDELTAYYHDLQQRLPTSESPAVALKALAAGAAPQP